jgi:hypothetical protein
MTTYHNFIDYDDDLPQQDFAVWCDACGDWIHDFKISGSNILCVCGNMVLKGMTPAKEKQTRAQIARAIWNL